MNNKLERITEWSPAWDKRDKDPKKNYGVHGMELKFVLKGEKGAIQFVIYTHWMLPQNRRNWDEEVKAFLLQPMPADVGYHSYVPLYEGQEQITDECPYLDGKPCYYDGSSTYADKVFDRFVTEGENAVWEVLEEEYQHRFIKGEDDD